VSGCDRHDVLLLTLADLGLQLLAEWDKLDMDGDVRLPSSPFDPSSDQHRYAAVI
jgi:hypothetical protein